MNKAQREAGVELLANQAAEEDRKYGVVWSSQEHELAQTGYVFDTIELAAAAGRKGLLWFKESQGQEIREAVGTQVDWTTDSDQEPTGFYVDSDDERFSILWHDPSGEVFPRGL